MDIISNAGGAGHEGVFIPWQYVLADAAVSGTLACRRDYTVAKTLIERRDASNATWFLIALGLVAVATQALSAHPVFTDRTQADGDFAVQGEYTGSVPNEGQELTVSVQAIARGNGRFDVVAYPGGLPGAGWDGGDRFASTGQRVGDGAVAIEVVDSGGTTRKGEIRAGSHSVLGPDGKEVARFPRVDRESPTLGHALQDSLVPKIVLTLEQRKSPGDDLRPPAQEIGRILPDHGEAELQPLARSHLAVFGDGFRAEHTSQCTVRIIRR